MIFSQKAHILLWGFQFPTLGLPIELLYSSHSLATSTGKKKALSLAHFYASVSHTTSFQVNEL